MSEPAEEPGEARREQNITIFHHDTAENEPFEAENGWKNGTK